MRNLFSFPWQISHSYYKMKTSTVPFYHSQWYYPSGICRKPVPKTLNSWSRAADSPTVACATQTTGSSHRRSSRTGRTGTNGSSCSSPPAHWSNRCGTANLNLLWFWYGSSRPGRCSVHLTKGSGSRRWAMSLWNWSLMRPRTGRNRCRACSVARSAALCGSLFCGSLVSRFAASRCTIASPRRQLGPRARVDFWPCFLLLKQIN